MSSNVSYIFLKVDGYTSFIFKSIFNAALFSSMNIKSKVILFSSLDKISIILSSRFAIFSAFLSLSFLNVDLYFFKILFKSFE